MRKYFRFFLTLILPIPCCFILMIGCNDESTKPPVDEEPAGYPVAKTISQLIANLRQSHIDMDYDEYEKTLSESYLFVFDPDDVGEGTGFLEEWPREDDLASTKKMFTGQPSADGRVVDGIVLEFVVGEAASSPNDPSWEQVILTAVELSMETTDPQGDKWFLETPGNYQVYLDLVQEPDADDSLVWKIIRFQDRPPYNVLASPGTKETTWGSIKSLFR